MLDINLLINWWKHDITMFIARLYRYKVYRWYKGGLWIYFKNDTWVQTTWYKKSTGYINHPQEGGVFHKHFNLIEKIEDYTK